MSTKLEYIFVDTYNNIINNKEDAEMIFAYMRISTDSKKQSTDRQESTLTEYAANNGFKFDKKYSDKISGSTKAESRPQYSKLKETIRTGDILVITDLDRLGRNADDTISELKSLKQDGIKVVALDVPLLNEWNKVNDDSIYDMIIDILITLKAHLAQQEREKTVSRINQGLAAARARGSKLGRPKAQLPENFIKQYELFKNGEYGKITAANFAKMLGIARPTLYKYIAIYNS